MREYIVYPETWYTVECWRHGQLYWVDTFHNLVTTVGKNKLLDAAFGAGLASPAWYVGLVDNAGFSAYAVGDTAASHSGWAESTIYAEATRQILTPGAIVAGSVDNGLSRAVFTINGSGTIRGGFLGTSSTKGGATGTLYGVGDFTAPRSVISGDFLMVKVTLVVT